MSHIWSNQSFELEEGMVSEDKKTLFLSTDSPVSMDIRNWMNYALTAEHLQDMDDDLTDEQAYEFAQQVENLVEQGGVSRTEAEKMLIDELDAQLDLLETQTDNFERGF